MAMTSINDAISAYNSAAQSIGGAKPAAAKDEGVMSGADFATMLRDGAKAAVAAGKKSEEMSAQAITGKADIPDVVAAVSNAELTLQTVVAVRDKVVSAYNDIMRMSF